MEGFTEGYVMGRDGGNNGGAWGNDGNAFLWILVILAMFGFGRGGWNAGNDGGGTGMGYVGGYDLGKLATTNDVASGFSTSTIMSNQGDIKLALQQGFAGAQQTMCQGFSGLNQAIATSGYETRDAITNLGYQLQACCCDVRQQIADVKYQMATDTCSIIQAGNANTQRIIDYLTAEKISSLQNENSQLTAQLSQNSQTRTILDAIHPSPVPAYPVFAPNASFAYPTGVAFGVNAQNCNCGCGL